jgi:phospholipid transport system transporter-binding protein
VRVLTLKDNKLVVDGAVTMDNVNALLEAGRAHLSQENLTVDLTGVSDVDSSAVSLLLEWMREARRHGKTLKLAGLPASLRTLADLYGVSELLAAS